jgi:SurA N-terminal domain
VLSLALAGCGGGSNNSGTSTAGDGGAASSTTSGLNAPDGGSAAKAKSAAGTTAPAKPPSNAVADVESTPIAKATFDHWLAVTAALSAQSASASNAALKDKVMGFLLTSEWVLGEAAALGVDVSEAAVQKRFAEIQKKQFKRPAELQKYLARNHETMADLLLRVKLEMLEAAISKKVTAGKRTAAERKAALASFQAQFESRWKAKTSCAVGFSMEDCG